MLSSLRWRVEPADIGAMTSILWLRQDLRLADNPALLAAAAEGAVLPVYVLDDETPGNRRMGAAQRWWLHHSLSALRDRLAAKGVRLILRRGAAADVIARLAADLGITRVHATRAYEPWWKAADAAIGKTLNLVLHDGAHLAPPETIRTGADGRYRMFTPYWRALRQRMPPPAPHHAPRAIEAAGGGIASDPIEDWGLLPSKPDWAAGFADIWRPGEAGAGAALDRFVDHVAEYAATRNLPSLDGTSMLSPHLHFGEISPATVWYRLTEAADDRAEPFLRELAWRDFAANVIDILPDYPTANGRPAFDRLRWRSGKPADADFTAWTKGRTGYPIVDAGMRQLWATGWLHNRVRMIAASFLVKHLLIDWRRGERWFWDTLVDADQGNNSVNWQWIAGTGIDSNMFPRIMAPLVQSEKFDAAPYIRRWVPELAEVGDPAVHDPHGAGASPRDYPTPRIGHREARERALAAYRQSKH